MIAREVELTIVFPGEWQWLSRPRWCRSSPAVWRASNFYNIPQSDVCIALLGRRERLGRRYPPCASPSGVLLTTRIKLSRIDAAQHAWHWYSWGSRRSFGAVVMGNYAETAEWCRFVRLGERLGPGDALGSSPRLPSVDSSAVALPCVRAPWTRANLSSSQYVSTLMKTKISAAPHKYAYRRPLWGRVRPCRNIFTRSSASCSRIRHLIISKRAKPDAPQAAIHEWQTKKKKKRGILQKIYKKQENYFFLFNALTNFSRAAEAHPWIRCATYDVFFFFGCEKTPTFAYSASPISQQGNVSAALAVWSKWKRFQSPQSARVVLYLGHTNWETGSAKRHHYSSKCSPSFDFLCGSVVLLKKNASDSGWQCVELQSGT